MAERSVRVLESSVCNVEGEKAAGGGRHNDSAEAGTWSVSPAEEM